MCCEIFTYDLVSDPGFETSTLKSIFERNQIRKQKINKILKNPLK